MAEKKQESKAKILIFDDSDFARKNIIQILEEEKFQVIGEASTAQTAGDLLTSTKANILIMDLMMPEKSGLELTKHFKENFRELSIIIISSLSQEQVIVDCLAQGACDFIKKPFKRHVLVDSIAKIENGLKED